MEEKRKMTTKVEEDLWTFPAKGKRKKKKFFQTSYKERRQAASIPLERNTKVLILVLSLDENKWPLVSFDHIEGTHWHEVDDERTDVFCPWQMLTTVWQTSGSHQNLRQVLSPNTLISCPRMQEETDRNFGWWLPSFSSSTVWGGYSMILNVILLSSFLTWYHISLGYSFFFIQMMLSVCPSSSATLLSYFQLDSWA